MKELKQKLFSEKAIFLEELPIFRGTLIKLRRAGIKTAQEAIAKTEYDLMQNKYLGRKTVNDIREALEGITGEYPFRGGFDGLEIGWYVRGRLVEIGITNVQELIKAGRGGLKKAGLSDKAIFEIKKAFQKIGRTFE